MLSVVCYSLVVVECCVCVVVCCCLLVFGVVVSCCVLSVAFCWLLFEVCRLVLVLYVVCYVLIPVGCHCLWCACCFFVCNVFAFAPGWVCGCFLCVVC